MWFQQPVSQRIRTILDFIPHLATMDYIIVKVPLHTITLLVLVVDGSSLLSLVLFFVGHLGIRWLMTTTLPCPTMIQGVVGGSWNGLWFTFFRSILFVLAIVPPGENFKSKARLRICRRQLLFIRISTRILEMFVNSMDNLTSKQIMVLLHRRAHWGQTRSSTTESSVFVKRKNCSI